MKSIATSYKIQLYIIFYQSVQEHGLISQFKKIRGAALCVALLPSSVQLFNFVGGGSKEMVASLVFFFASDQAYNNDGGVIDGLMLTGAKNHVVAAYGRRLAICRFKLGFPSELIQELLEEMILLFVCSLGLGKVF